MVTMYL